MSIPDIALAKIRRFCEHGTPPEFRDQMRLEATSRGNSVTISDHRPFWDASDEWVSTKIAQLRFQPETQEWTLYWAVALRSLLPLRRKPSRRRCGRRDP
jgi:Protein of unknown function (DUF3024)